MNRESVWRTAGIFGLAACAIALCEFPTWFLAESPLPSFADAPAISAFAARNSTLYLTRTLMDMLAFACLTGAVALDTIGARPDPSVLRGLHESTFLMYGSVALILLGMMLGIAAIQALSTRALPRWNGVLAAVTSGLCFVFVPTMYFGTDPTGFYTASGWGTAVGATFPFMAWILATSVVLVRKRPQGR